jgi:hypothetical protein
MVSDAASKTIETSHSAVVISDGPSHGFILGDVGRKDARTPEKFFTFIRCQRSDRESFDAPPMMQEVCQSH